MYLAQIQLYIDEKNWDELAKVILDVGFKNIRFTREFLDEFLLSGKYDYIFTDKNADSFYVSIFFELLLERLKSSNIELSKDDYLKIIKLAYLVKNSKSETQHFKKIVSIDRYKNQEYVKLFLDENFVTEISNNIENDNFKRSFTKEHFDGLKPEEVRKILTNINNSFPSSESSRIRIRPEIGYDESIFSAIAESPEELITLDLSKYGLYGKRCTYGSILRNLPAKKFKELVRKLLYEEKHTQETFNIFKSLMDYHFYKDNSLKIEYSDKEISDMISFHGSFTLGKIAPSLTFEQIKKYSRYIGIENLLKNKKLSIKQIGEIFTKKYIHLLPISYYRFVREEDLLDAPHLFNPDSVLSSASIYCSKKTFSVLNKEWGKRKRWKPYLTDFKRIFINNIQYNNLDEDSFIYLIQKAKPSNEEIFDVIKEANYQLEKYSKKIENNNTLFYSKEFEIVNNTFLKNAKYILKFLEKYKQ